VTVVDEGQAMRSLELISLFNLDNVPFGGICHSFISFRLGGNTALSSVELQLINIANLLTIPECYNFQFGVIEAYVGFSRVLI
jgi:hypothetical protein